MASGKDLKRRIVSTKSTQQITKAMKMVAAARLRRAQEAIVRARPFAGAILETVQNLVRIEDIREHHPLLAKREVKRVNVILITGDRGLSGGYNSNLNKKAELMYKAESQSGKYEKIVFTCIGKKGFEYLRLRKIPVAHHYADFLKGANYAKSQIVAEELLNQYLSGEFDEIRIIFSEFRSAMSQIPTAVTVLPIQAGETPAATEKNPTADVDFIYEPNQEAILNALLPRYFKAKLFNAILEAIASQYGAQMSAMESATKNAGEMIRKLNLEYNKVRQAGITKELLEIVSGAESLK
ncbi:MAG: ATP synthase F1 subunit gamma [Bdellovibrionota bacterium]